MSMSDSLTPWVVRTRPPWSFNRFGIVQEEGMDLIRKFSLTQLP